jgi:hypothetical protein
MFKAACLRLNPRARHDILMFRHLHLAFIHIGLSVLLVGGLRTDKGKKAYFTFDSFLASTIGSCQPDRSEQFIHLLKSATFGFRYKEDDIEHSNGRDASKEDKCAEIAFLEERRCSSTDCEVVQLQDNLVRGFSTNLMVYLATYPVTTTTHTNTLGTHAEREYFGSNNPRNRSCSGTMVSRVSHLQEISTYPMSRRS